MSGYSGTTKDGREVYIPHWPVDVAVKNLSKAGQFIGAENLIRIAEINIPAVILAIATSEDAINVAGLVKHFVCEARLDGDKITPTTYDSKFEGDLKTVAELFALVVHAQYHDFFESGLAKEPSQEP